MQTQTQLGPLSCDIIPKLNVIPFGSCDIDPKLNVIPFGSCDIIPKLNAVLHVIQPCLIYRLLPFFTLHNIAWKWKSSEKWGRPE